MTRSEAILKAWNGAWGNGDLSAFENLVAPDYVRRSKSGSEDYASLRKTIEVMHNAFPDSSTEILNIVEDGKKVAGKFSDLKVGQTVEASFSGAVSESYPVQGTASEIVILQSR